MLKKQHFQNATRVYYDANLLFSDMYREILALRANVVHSIKVLFEICIPAKKNIMNYYS